MSIRALATVADLLSGRRPGAGPISVVAVDGPSGAGKTTLAARLAPVLRATVVHMDDIYPGWDGLAQAPGLLVEGILRPLSEYRRASYRRWDWERGLWADRRYVEPDDVLVVEGVGCGARVCAPYLSLLLWVDAPADVRMTRGIDRDGEAYRPHWERWAAQEQTMFAAERTRGRADLVVDGAPEVEYDDARELVVVA